MTSLILSLLPMRRSNLLKALPIGKNAAKTLLAQLRRDKVIVYDGGVVVAYRVADTAEWFVERNDDEGTCRI